MPRALAPPSAELRTRSGRTANTVAQYEHDASEIWHAYGMCSCPWGHPGVTWAVQFSYYINNRPPNGSLSTGLSRLAVEVRVDGDDETQRKEHEREGDQEETRHRVLACVPSEYR